MPKGKAKPNRRAFRFRPRTKRQLKWVTVAMVLAVVGWFAYKAPGKAPGTSVTTLGNDHLQSLSTPHPP